MEEHISSCLIHKLSISTLKEWKLKCHDETNLVPLSYACYLMCERTGAFWLVGMIVVQFISPRYIHIRQQFPLLLWQGSPVYTFYILLVLCKYLLISSSLESKHPKSTFLSYKWRDRCMLMFLILYLFLLGSQTMFVSNQGFHFKAGPGEGNRELTDDGGQRGCLAWELKGTKWSQLLVWEGWGQHAKQGSSPPARLCFEGLSDFLLFNMKL